MPTATQERIIRPARNVLGSLRLPGDKSISHRYGMLGRICRRHLALLQLLHRRRLRLHPRLHAGARRQGPQTGRRTRSKSTGVGGRVTPANHPLDCGNSGSTMRMISGLLAPQQGSFTLIGDASLSRRPMERIRKPLAEHGRAPHAHRRPRAPR